MNKGGPCPRHICGLILWREQDTPHPCSRNICGLILWREQENKREDGTPGSGLISTIMQIMQIKQKDPQFTTKRGGRGGEGESHHLVKPKKITKLRLRFK